MTNRPRTSLLTALLLGPALLLGACASTGPGPGEAQLDPAALEAALEADLFGGGSVDLAAALEAGRPVTLVFWQAW